MIPSSSHSFVHSLVHTFTHSFFSSFVPSCILFFCTSFLPSCIPSLTHSFIPTVLQLPWTIVSDVCPEDVKNSHKKLDEALKGYKEVADKDWSERCFSQETNLFLKQTFVPSVHPRRSTSKWMKMIVWKMFFLLQGCILSFQAVNLPGSIECWCQVPGFCGCVSSF